MKIVAIEGLDKATKHTASKALADALNQKGYKAVQSEFHRYDTPTGKLIMDWLTGKWDVSQHTIELIMAADKQAQQENIKHLEENLGVDYLILDRYTTSQLAYAISNDVDYLWVKSLQEHMRRPDIEIIIDISPETSMSRKGKHNDGQNDRYESDKAFLTRVRNYYIEYARVNQNVHLVMGEQSKEDVVSAVMDTFRVAEEMQQR